MKKELKLKVRKFWGLTPTFAEATWEKLVRIGLTRVKVTMLKSSFKIIVIKGFFVKRTIKLIVTGAKCWCKRK